VPARLIEYRRCARAAVNSADPRKLETENLSEVAARIDRIKDVARIADRAQHAELSRQDELTRRLSKGWGLGDVIGEGQSLHEPLHSGGIEHPAYHYARRWSTLIATDP
jgi:hypothetical protein